MKHDLAIRALKLAVNLRQPPPDCIHHTDRGSQYRSHDYQKILRRQGFKVSMSGKGNCYDNSAVATFFKTLKAELIWRHRRETRRQAEIAFGTCREPMATDASLRIHQRVLQCASQAFSPQREKPGRLREQGGLREQRTRHFSEASP